MSIKRGFSILLACTLVLAVGVGPRTADKAQALPPVSAQDASSLNLSYPDYSAASLVTTSSGTAFRWDIQTVDSTNNVGSHTSAAIDPRDDTVFISYYDAVPNTPVLVAATAAQAQ